jgi:hypothetical protein
MHSYWLEQFFSNDVDGFRVSDEFYAILLQFDGKGYQLNDVANEVLCLWVELLDWF